MKPDSIRDRMDLALEKARQRRLEPNAFYLTEEDWNQFDSEISADWGSPCHCFSWRDVQIRRGETSKLYTWHGIGVSIPKRAPAVDRRRRRGERKELAARAQQPVERRRRA